MIKTKYIATASVAAALLSGGALSVTGQADPPHAPVSAIAKGAPPANADKVAWMLEDFKALGPDAAKARAVKSAAGKQWTLAPASDGGVCYVVGTVAGCDKAAGVAEGALSFTTIALPPLAERKRQAAELRRLAERGEKAVITDAPRTEAVRQGVVADGIEEVRSLDAAGRQIAEASVVNNVYALSLGLEGDAATIQFVGGDGTIVSERDAY